MDGSQVTGASSSYARKYALNGLFCIDDTADSDTTNVGDGKEKAAPQKKSAAKKAAEPAAAPAPAVPKDNTAVIYEKWVEAIARGTKTKSGREPREAYIAQYNVTADQLERLDYDVFQYRLQHGIKANEKLM